MNANELAEKLLDCLSSEDRLEIRSASAQMLRKQQTEIEVLKAAKIRAYDNGVEDGRKPNTHPANPYQSITNTKIEPTVVSYTHPVKELDEDFDAICLENKRLQAEIEVLKELNTMLKDAIEKRIKMDQEK